MRYNNINKLAILIATLAKFVIAEDTCYNGYKCCSHCNVILDEDNVLWGAENGEWCEIPSSCNISKDECFSSPYYPCCSSCDVILEDNDGKWGYENNSWCGLKDTCNSALPDDVKIVEDGKVFPNDPFIYYTARWDKNNMTQWANSGFKLDFSGTSFTFVSGSMSMNRVECGFSLDYGDFVFLNITRGANVLVENIPEGEHSMRFWTSGLENHFLQMDHLEIDAGAKIHKYIPQDKYIQVVGDSMSSGYKAPNQSMDSYSFLLGQYLNYEVDIFATPGICLTDHYCYSKDRGLSFQYFQLQNVEFGKSEPYDFSKSREPDYIIINIGTNDYTTKVATKEEVKENMVEFVHNIQAIYPDTKILVDNYYGDFWKDLHADIADKFEKNVYFADVQSDIILGAPDIIPYNGHFTQKGNCHAMEGMAKRLNEWFGVEPIGWNPKNWGHNTGVEPAKLCVNPLDESVIYHYSFEGYNGVGAW